MWPVQWDGMKSYLWKTFYLASYNNSSDYLWNRCNLITYQKRDLWGQCVSFTLLCFGVTLMEKSCLHVVSLIPQGRCFQAFLLYCIAVHRYIQSILKILLSVLLGVYPVLMKTEDFSCITTMCIWVNDRGGKRLHLLLQQGESTHSSARGHMNICHAFPYRLAWTYFSISLILLLCDCQI